MLIFKHSSEVKFSLTGYEIYSDFIPKAYANLSKIANLNQENITFLHSDLQVDLVNEKYDIVHSACAFEGQVVSTKISSIMKEKDTSVALIPVIRKDQEQDLTLFQFDAKSKILIENRSIMRSLFTEAKSKVESPSKSDSEVDKYFYNSPNEVDDPDYQEPEPEKED